MQRKASSSTAPSDERPRDREQHGRMTVVSTSVHDSVRSRRELDAALLLDRRASMSARSANVTPGRPLDSRATTLVGVGLVISSPPNVASLSYEPSRFVLVERQLGVSMEMTPPRDRLARNLIHAHRAEAYAEKPARSVRAEPQEHCSRNISEHSRIGMLPRSTLWVVVAPLGPPLRGVRTRTEMKGPVL
jgi:hypothetical protein